jgi:hypothetical protein
VQEGHHREAFSALSEAVKHKRDSWQTWANYVHAAIQTGNLLQAARGIAQVRSLSYELPLPGTRAGWVHHSAFGEHAMVKTTKALEKVVQSLGHVWFWYNAALAVAGPGRWYCLEQCVLFLPTAFVWGAQVLAQSQGQRAEEDLLRVLVDKVADARRAAGTYGQELPGLFH